MVFIMQTMRVHEMCSRGAQCTCFRVHKFGKCLLTSGYMLCNCRTAVSAGAEKQSAQKIVQADLVPCAQPAGHFIPVEISGMFTDRDRIVQAAVFQCQICC